jgi:hypothetical protein
MQDGIQLTANRNTRGQFLPGGSPGRPKGARNKLAAQVFDDLFAHWSEPVSEDNPMPKGREALETMYREKPNEYVRAVLSVMPKELAVENVMTDITDEQLDELMARIRDHLLTARKADAADTDEEPKVH